MKVVSAVLPDIIVVIINKGADVENDFFDYLVARTGSLVDLLSQTLERNIEGVSDLDGLTGHVLLHQSDHFGL